MRATRIAVALTMVFAVNCYASNWFEMNESISIDMDSVVQSGRYVSVWVKRTFTPTTVPSGVPKDAYQALTRWRLDCVEHRYAYGAGTLLSQKGNVLHQTDGTPNAFHDAPPDTLADVMLNVFCPKQ